VEPHSKGEGVVQCGQWPGEGDSSVRTFCGQGGGVNFLRWNYSALVLGISESVWFPQQQSVIL